MENKEKANIWKAFLKEGAGKYSKWHFFYPEKDVIEAIEVTQFGSVWRYIYIIEENAYYLRSLDASETVSRISFLK